MAKLMCGGVEREIACSEEELAEAMKLEDDIMFNCWLGVVEERGHAEAMAWARKYSRMLKES